MDIDVSPVHEPAWEDEGPLIMLIASTFELHVLRAGMPWSTHCAALPCTRLCGGLWTAAGSSSKCGRPSWCALPRPAPSKLALSKASLVSAPNSLRLSRADRNRGAKPRYSRLRPQAPHNPGFQTVIFPGLRSIYPHKCHAT